MVYDDDIPEDSESFRFFWEQFNGTQAREGASSFFDTFSGGFGFSDEVPETLRDSNEFVRPLTNLLRRLWGCRMSLVAGNPRADLLPYWDRAKELAPHWAGFSADRCSAEMRAMADETRANSAKFAREWEELDANFRKRQEAVASGAAH